MLQTSQQNTVVHHIKCCGLTQQNKTQSPMLFVRLKKQTLRVPQVWKNLATNKMLLWERAKLLCSFIWKMARRSLAILLHLMNNSLTGLTWWRRPIKANILLLACKTNQTLFSLSISLTECTNTFFFASKWLLWNLGWRSDAQLNTISSRREAVAILWSVWEVLLVLFFVFLFQNADHTTAVHKKQL